MPQTSQAQIAWLLAARHDAAIAAAEAIAHHLDTADQLETRQRDLEEALEDLLPPARWRQLFPTWVVDDIRRAHDPHTDPRPTQCTLCKLAQQQPHRHPLAATG